MQLYGTVWTMGIVRLFALVVLLGARVGVCGNTITCGSGQYNVAGECTMCPARHYCRGDGAPAAQCPANSFDFHAGTSSTLDDCACDAGYFRTDNTETLALALAQNGVSLHDSRRLWCVLCPVGYLCHTLQDGTGPRTRVQECPALATTQGVGSFASADCVCRPGSYANSSSSCIVCSKNHYCTGGTVPPSACPRQTVSSRGATSLAGCTCLPPLVMLPTVSPLFLFDCVQQSAAAFTDAGITHGLQTQQYNIFGIEASGLFANYAVASGSVCMMIQTGVSKFMFDSCIVWCARVIACVRV